MNGNIQVEPIRVKLDKQGATSLKEEKTVDAIVRPQLTKLRPTQVTQVSQYLSISVSYVSCVGVVFVQPKKFLKNFGGQKPHWRI